MKRAPSAVRLVAGCAALAGVLLLSAPLRGHVSSLLPSPEPVRAEFTRHDGSLPVTWAPCSTIEVLVNPGSFGAPAIEEIRSVFAEVSESTGLRFSFAESTLVPRSDWAHSLGGTEAPPVLVAWVDPSDTDLISDSASGSTVANPSRVAGRSRIVTGAIALDATEYGSFSAEDGPGRTRRNLILHEIGHLLGLDHVDGGGLMDPTLDRGTGDGFHAAELSALESVYGPATRCSD